MSALVIEGVEDAGEVIRVRARTRGGAVACPGRARDAGFVTQCGADEVLDYRTVDPRDIGPFGVIIDTAGRDLLAFRRPLNRHGRMVTLNFGSAPAMASIAASNVFGARRIRTFRDYPDRQLLTDIAQYVESGALRLGAGEAAEFDTREPHSIGRGQPPGRGAHAVQCPGRACPAIGWPRLSGTTPGVCLVSPGRGRPRPPLRRRPLPPEQLAEVGFRIIQLPAPHRLQEADKQSDEAVGLTQPHAVRQRAACRRAKADSDAPRRLGAARLQVLPAVARDAAASTGRT